jgi:galactose oxidase-like protein
VHCITSDSTLPRCYGGNRGNTTRVIRPLLAILLVTACGDGRKNSFQDANVPGDGVVDPDGAQPGDGMPTDGAAIDAAMADAPPPFGPGWTFADSMPPVGFRFAHAMVLDTTHTRFVVFGGDKQPLLGDTWVFDGVTWTQKLPATSPSARREHAMAYDSGRDRVVLFGGTTQNERLGDTWEFDGTTWLQRTPATSPPTLFGATMAYDAATNQTILFGGTGPLDISGDTWSWNGANWTKLAPSASPPARTGSAMVYDPVRQRIVLFGGETSVLFGDTWEWTGTTWVQRTTANAPPPRCFHAMAYDADRQRLVLFGGFVGGAALQANDTWEYDGTDWAHKITTTQPMKRQHHALAFHPARHAVFFYGGEDSTGFYNDLWAYTGL